MMILIEMIEAIKIVETTQLPIAPNKMDILQRSKWHRPQRSWEYIEIIWVSILMPNTYSRPMEMAIDLVDYRRYMYANHNIHIQFNWILSEHCHSHNYRFCIQKRISFD